MPPRFVWTPWHEENIFQKHPEVTPELIERIVRTPEQRKAVGGRKKGKPSFMVSGRDAAGVVYEIGYRIETDVEDRPVFVWHAMRADGRNFTRVVEKTIREEDGRVKREKIEGLLRKVAAEARERSSASKKRRSKHGREEAQD